MKNSIYICIPCIAISLFGCNNQDNRTLIEKLRDMPLVTEVKELENAQDSPFSSTYELSFISQIDYKDASKGEFTQKAFLQLRDDKKPTVVCIEGYTYNASNLSIYKPHELETLLDANVIHIEHRYFGNSIPTGLDNNKIEYWNDLTLENAATDQANIINSFKNVLKNKMVATGKSKGGLCTNVLSYFYPDCCDLFVPYVAPFCTSQNDDRLVKFIYEKAGDNFFCSEETLGKRVRDELTKAQIFMLENRNKLQEMVFNVGAASGYVFKSNVSKEKLFDELVLDFAIASYQTGLYMDEDLTQFNAMPFTTEEEKEDKLGYAYLYLGFSTNISTFSNNWEYYPYYVQAYKEIGHYKTDLSYLRKAIADAGSTATIYVTEEEDNSATFNFTLGDELLNGLTYDRTVMNKMNNYYDEAKANIIAINGGEDPWNSVKIPNPTKYKENVNVFVNPIHCHSVAINSFEQTAKNQIINLIKNYMN